MADFSVLPLGQVTSLLSDAEKGAKMEHTQIANNIANVNTPNFRTSSVDFKTALQQSLGVPQDPDQLAMAADSSRDFTVGDAQPPVPFAPQPEVDYSTQMRADGSNVDIDQQMAQLSENTGYSETISQLLQEQYKFMREAVTEQTN